MSLKQQMDLFFFRFFMVYEWRSESIAANRQISFSDLSILELISCFDGIRAKGIATFLRKSESTISRSINRLETIGLLNKGEKNGLEIPLHLTLEGRVLLEQNCCNCTFSVSDSLVGKMNTEEQELLLKCLTIINDKQQEVLMDAFRGDFSI